MEKKLSWFFIKKNIFSIPDLNETTLKTLNYIWIRLDNKKLGTMLVSCPHNLIRNWHELPTLSTPLVSIKFINLYRYLETKCVGSLFHSFHENFIKIEMDFIDLIVSYQTWWIANIVKRNYRMCISPTC